MTNESLKPNPNILRKGMIVGIQLHQIDGDATYVAVRNPCFSLSGEIFRIWGTGTVGEARCRNRDCSYTETIEAKQK